ncbi:MULTISPECIES: hypothetical protein [Providencia]|uniref:Uncharacterized protein n=2 Tax=Providencia rustigianii TaxID=158850 RepID=D1P552_9GAMM|nr:MULTISPECIES: hypothetical protein [Providencia]EFB71413.1 hypothetical protein PROVRUST_07357 [Providencia rustigianii DSM 4541]MTC57704.1 hypothetical protein [Providencia rustigianii]SPY77800.1 Uncharacterised protein [Providencia rustigianii]SUC27323.1 Uncharacterised protein [Providencia rustigianii]SUC35787.1 Uncharacterised protein [Providencia rustigianii]
MKRIKSKLLIIILLAVGAFGYQFYTSIGDSDIKKSAEKLVESKLGTGSSIIFTDVNIVLKSEFKDGESYRVCGFYQVKQQDEKLPFVASINVQEGVFSEHNQLIVSETPELRTAITTICEKSKE